MRHGFAIADAAALAFLLVAAAIASGEAGGRTVVNILDRAPLYSAPDGPPMGFDQTLLYERGSAWVVRRQGDWLGISTIERNRGRLAWIRQTAKRPLTTTQLLVVVDLSEHRVHVQRGARALMTAPVTSGSPGSPSPIASTSVWKRIKVTPRSGFDRASYGPVIVALRLWQDRPSPGNPDGGIMAFHGGGGFARGRALSGGCFRMRNADALRLAYHVRGGTPVIIRP